MDGPIIMMTAVALAALMLPGTLVRSNAVEPSARTLQVPIIISK
jgi:hypothetical protein